MADHSELKRLAESLNRAIEQAEHKPGQWAETAQSMGGICCAGEPFQIGKPWAKEDPWAHFSYKRDSWLAVAAVNALPQLMALIAENEALKGLYRMHQQTETREMRDLKAEIAGLKTGYEAYEQVNTGLKAEVEKLRKSAPSKEVAWCSCGDGHAANSYGAGFMDANDGVCANCDAAMGKGGQS